MNNSCDENTITVKVEMYIRLFLITKFFYLEDTVFKNLTLRERKFSFFYRKTLTITKHKYGDNKPKQYFGKNT